MLESLFSPYTLKGKTIKNRIVVPAMVANYCANDGKATERYIAYHETKAKGGFGLIITEDYAVDPRGRGFSNVAGLWCDEQIESHTELVNRVHQYGTTIFAQIYHCGRQTNHFVLGQAPQAPSAIPCPTSPDVPEEFTTEEVRVLVGKFGDTALRAKKCGFDGIEIHAGHGYLIAEFLSPYANKRSDRYGGTFMNRSRFLLEIIHDIREKCGEDFIIGMRISGDERIEGGRTLVDTLALLPLVEEAGVDIIHISAGTYGSGDTIVPPSYTPHAWTADWAAAVKQNCNIPVITVGRINDPVIADSLICSGKADFTAMGRASLIDPEMPNKAKEGRFEDIRYCTGCCAGCIGVLFTDQPIKCVLNPTLGHETECEIVKAEKPKNVAVIGAGPAGLETAITARQAGHEVTVYEKEDHAGGLFHLAAVPPCKGEISGFIAWQTTQCAKLGVEIRYNTEATVEMMKEEKPDVIVVAVGAVPVKPPIPGVDSPTVVYSSDLLSGKYNAAMNCVVVGGGQVGAETANFLAQQLRTVTLLEMRDMIAPEEAMSPRMQLMQALLSRGVHIQTGVTVKEITDHSVKVTGSVEAEYPAEMVVLATGYKSRVGIEKELADAGFDVRTITHENGIGNVLGATSQGFELGRSL